MPLDSDLSDKLSEGLGELTYEGASEWVSGFNSARAEDDYFLVMPKGEAHYSRGAFENSVKLELSVSYRPKENVGDSLGNLTDENSTFSGILRSLPKDKHFLYFLVYPGDIEVFREARDYAETNFGIGCGWGPIGEGNPIRFNLSGGGGITPVDQ